MFISKYKDDSEKSTGLLFMRVYNKWHLMIKKELKKINLTHPQFVVLASLAYLSQNENEVTQVMISKLSEIDTRAKVVILNKKGEEILKTAVPLIEKIDELFFGKLNSHEEQFKHFLVQLNKE